MNCLCLLAWLQTVDNLKLSIVQAVFCSDQEKMIKRHPSFILVLVAGPIG